MSDYPLFEINPIYHKKLSEHLNCVKYEGLLAEEKGNESVQKIEVKIENIKLQCLVEKKSHKIISMKHCGNATNTQRALLNALSAFSINWSIQDVSEHALLRLENRLRDFDDRPVMGVVMPENADKAFMLPLLFARKLLEKYTNVTGYQTTQNFDDEAPCESWRHLSQNEKIKQIESIIPECCEFYGLSYEDVEIKKVDFEVRITIVVKKLIKDKPLREFVTQFERLIKTKIDRRLELYLENVRDQSAVRRDVQENKI